MKNSTNCDIIQELESAFLSSYFGGKHFMRIVNQQENLGAVVRRYPVDWGYQNGKH